jgi:hypothetical protein
MSEAAAGTARRQGGKNKTMTTRGEVMTMKKGRIKLRAAAVSAALLALTALMTPVQSGAFARRPPSALAAAAAATDCEGDACAQVTLAFDDAKQQYRAVNNSADRWARVTASNMAGSASACLTPGGAAYLPLKSVAGPYHAAYAEARCGEPETTGPPSGE